MAPMAVALRSATGLAQNGNAAYCGASLPHCVGCDCAPTAASCDGDQARGRLGHLRRLFALEEIRFGGELDTRLGRMSSHWRRNARSIIGSLYARGHQNGKCQRLQPTPAQRTYAFGKVGSRPRKGPLRTTIHCRTTQSSRVRLWRRATI